MRGNQNFNMTETTNLFHKITIYILLLIATIFACDSIFKTIEMQNNTAREIEKIEMETKEQCRQWAEENSPVVMRMRSIKNGCYYDASANNESSRRKGKKKKK